MTNIGAEVGQKMRSAIKAKLLELNCYVDDELPDYIMVMVANKRTKSQMKEDLQLFLAAKTATFVDWLHIVLKKLKEVTVTNPEVYKKTVKRKTEDLPDIDIKKEKKDKKKKRDDSERSVVTEEEFKSLTDDLPINANRLSEQRKIIIMKENKQNNTSDLMHDNFDIPLLSEVNMSTEEELEDIERKIKTVKSRLGFLVESEEEEEDCINLKAEPDELLVGDRNQVSEQRIQILNASSTDNGQNIQNKPERTRITFNKDELTNSTKRRSILDRLGKREASDSKNKDASSFKRARINLDFDKQENSSRIHRVADRDRDKRTRRENRSDSRTRRGDKPKESVLSRLGVMSKVSIPQKEPEEPEEPVKNREVPSVIKIKPRVIPSDVPQPNKNLLLKAVAEAQKSIAQTPKVGNSFKHDALFTKGYKNKLKSDPQGPSKKIPESEKNKLKKLLSVPEDKEEYVAPVVKIVQETPKFVPSAKEGQEDGSAENGKVKQQFIVTLDGIEKTKFKDLACDVKPSIKSRLDSKKSPSPIIFDKASTSVKAKSNIPDKLPIVHAPPSIKNKERCKYWPSCRQGDKCEFVHPTTNCDKFPHCKFGDKCLYLHPTCKFGSSCTRRDCPYSHAPANKPTASPVKLGPQSLQTCKFFPNCTNVNCSFYHPKACKFGKYCKNQAECSFSHSYVPNKSSLIWRSK